MIYSINDDSDIRRKQILNKLPDINYFYKVIKSLPLKEKYTKEELLIPELLVEQQGNIELYYCAHNEVINPRAKIFIIGITPGFQQMEKSIVTARRCIEEGLSVEETVKCCKKAARFSGSLRKNMIQMLEELELHNALKIENMADLFDERDDLLHTTSMIPFSTFVNKKNYTGHQPNLMRNEFLMGYVEKNLIPQIDILKNALIIPAGRCVEEVIDHLVQRGILKEAQCLKGFPHPSGANVNCKKQFEKEKFQMMNKIKAFEL